MFQEIPPTKSLFAIFTFRLRQSVKCLGAYADAIRPWPKVTTTIARRTHSSTVQHPRLAPTIDTVSRRWTPIGIICVS